MSVNSPLIHFLTIGRKDAILFEGFIGSVEFDPNNGTMMAWKRLRRQQQYGRRQCVNDATPLLYIFKFFFNFFFFRSALLQICFLCWDRWNGMWRLHLTQPCYVALGQFWSGLYVGHELRALSVGFPLSQDGSCIAERDSFVVDIRENFVWASWWSARWRCREFRVGCRSVSPLRQALLGMSRSASCATRGVVASKIVVNNWEPNSVFPNLVELWEHCN